MSTPSQLTTTSYSILGLLALRPWTTYELAQQMDRSLKNFWPRAASRIYEEPKRLAALGLARATKEHTGKRPRTVYAITAKGRRTLASWLTEPGAGPQLEFEALVKVFFSEFGTRSDALDSLAAIKAWADEKTAENIGFARLFRDSGGPFPERLAQITLIGRFLTEFADMVNAWADWAIREVSAWPADPAMATPDWTMIKAIAAREIPSPS